MTTLLKGTQIKFKATNTTVKVTRRQGDTYRTWDGENQQVSYSDIDWMHYMLNTDKAILV